MTKLPLTALLLGALILPGTARGAELAIVGTGDGIELLQALSAVFNADHPDIATSIPASIGSGGAVAAVGAERSVLGRIARPLSETEKAQGLVAVPVAKIPSAFFVHGTVSVQGLTAAQIAGIFGGAVTNWKEVGGDDLRIKVVRREETDSTLSVLRASMPGWRDLALTPYSKLATTTQDAVETVKRVPGSIGFGPYSVALDQGATVLAVDGRRPFDPDYPSAITLALVYKASTVDANARAFAAFVTSPRAQQTLAGRGGVPLGD
ncbi:hypothetical protein OPKNFCMD_2999 [Methylobacterium crusticola]|uniref:PBP domain-containing protein n=1 Tax=Methylobacterium crusticola TaxID=1697972 RepID=A0ABQ4QXZ2_9HYPH|nr:substrate-binding domain-containing protein [Methylobacterium crusticola]GJD50262.1 hypothetical protein OPKNFCMD_2999 [Methylobacterium crusticola]